MDLRQLDTWARMALDGCWTGARADGNYGISTSELTEIISHNVPLARDNIARGLIELAPIAPYAWRGDPETRVIYGKSREVKPWRWGGATDKQTMFPENAATSLLARVSLLERQLEKLLTAINEDRTLRDAIEEIRDMQ